MDWVGAIVNGILSGGFLALLAAGLSFMFGVMRIVNLAHGAMAVLGAYLGLWLMDVLPIPWWVSLIIIVPIMAGIGWLLQFFVLNRSLRENQLAPIIVTFGIAVVIASLLQELFSSDPQSIKSGGLSTASVTIVPGLTIGWLPITAFLVGIAVILLLQLFLAKTRSGRAMRATSDDQLTAQLMGVDNRRIYALATAIALGVVAIAGIFLGLRTQFSPYSGNDQLIFAFEAVIIGGLGSLWGTLAGGVVLGLATAIGNQVWSGYGVFIAHLLFLVILAIRPTGFFQKAVTA
jgi:branched-chain amino acid transport system permease protein